MKISVISSLSADSTAVYLINALISIGHEVFTISDVDHPLVDVKALEVFYLPKVLQDHSFTPNFVIFIEGGSMRLFPSGLQEIECLTAWYGIDTHMNYEKHLKICRVFDISFIAQFEFVGKLRFNGVSKAHWLPLAFDPNLTPSSDLKRSIDIAYIGSMQYQINPERHHLIENLKSKFLNHYFGRANPADMARIYSSSYLVFNRSVRNDVNMRFFEAMGSGAVLISNEIVDNGADQLFEEGIHYLTYKDEKSLAILVKELLQDPSRCREIGETARSHILSQHTYAHRAHEIIKIINSNTEKKKIIPEFYISALLAQGFIGGATLEFSSLIERSLLTGRVKWLADMAALVIKMLAYGIGYVELIKRKLRK